MLYKRCTGIYKFGNNTYPWRIRRRSNLGHIFQEKKCALWAGKYGTHHVQIHDSKQEWINLLKSGEPYGALTTFDILFFPVSTELPTSYAFFQKLFAQDGLCTMWYFQETQPLFHKKLSDYSNISRILSYPLSTKATLPSSSSALCGHPHPHGGSTGTRGIPYPEIVSFYK